MTPQSVRWTPSLRHSMNNSAAGAMRSSDCSASISPRCKEAKIKMGTSPIVDLGCGRGEWLELLQEEGFQAKGVDQNHILVEECVRAGLDVVEGDLLTYLCGLPDQTHRQG